MKVFEYVTFFEGVEDDNGEWVRKPEVLTFDRVVAESQDKVNIIAARSIPEDHLDVIDRISIAVRPF